MTTCWFGLLLIYQGLLAGAMGQAPAAGEPGDLAGVNPRWLEPTEKTIEKQIELLTAAFDLDGAHLAALREELHRRLVAQVPVERQYQKDKLQFARDARRRARSGQEVTNEERRTFMAAMKQRLEAMPLNERRVADWMEQQLPHEQAVAGRVRLEELWHRRDQQRLTFEADTQRQSGARAAMNAAKKAELAESTPDGRPVPHRPPARPVRGEVGTQGEGRDVVRPNQALAPLPQKPLPPPKLPTWANHAPTDVEPVALSVPPNEQVERGGQSEEAEPKSSGPSASPVSEAGERLPVHTLEEWDKYVFTVAQEYSLTDAQVTQARSILAALSQRAQQYWSSRAADYMQAKSLTDPKDRVRRLAELDTAINALFVELKNRLESLPTPGQSQKRLVPLTPR